MSQMQEGPGPVPEKTIQETIVGKQFELTVDLPRLGLKAGHQVTMMGQKAETIFEVAAWSEQDKRSLQAMVDGSWLRPIATQPPVEPKRRRKPKK